MNTILGKLYFSLTLFQSLTSQLQLHPCPPKSLLTPMQVPSRFLVRCFRLRENIVSYLKRLTEIALTNVTALLKNESKKSYFPQELLSKVLFKVLGSWSRTTVRSDGGRRRIISKSIQKVTRLQSTVKMRNWNRSRVLRATRRTRTKSFSSAILSLALTNKSVTRRWMRF